MRQITTEPWSYDHKAVDADKRTIDIDMSRWYNIIAFICPQ